MNTAQLDRPAPAAPRRPDAGRLDAGRPGARRFDLSRITQLRRTTPGRLQLILVALLALAVGTGAATGLAANSAATSTDDLGNRTQPLLIEAETVYTALADADATAAQAFLAGGLEPVALTERYDDDLRRATTALASAARRTPGDGPTATAVDTLAAGISEYAGLVATARANNRQGLPVGASYLSVASTLNRETLQPQAKSLFLAAQSELDDGYTDARSTIWLSVLGLLLIALLVALIAAQRHLSRTTRRTFNVPLVAATVVTGLLTLGVVGVFALQRAHLGNAEDDGSTPIVTLAEVRIQTLLERSDEALTLAGRGADVKYEQDFVRISGELSGPDGLLARAADTVERPERDTAQARAARTAVETATQRHTEYVAAHAEVRKLDAAGQYDKAVALAIGPATTKTFTELTEAVGTAVEAKKVTFTDEITAAGRGLGLLTLLGPLLALAVCAFAVAGIRARLEEYR